MSEFLTPEERCIEFLERENAQLKAALAEQKELIERLQSEIDVEEKRFNQLADDYADQATLIENLAEALWYAIREFNWLPSIHDKLNGALQQYEIWKNK